jgi:putative transposase
MFYFSFRPDSRRVSIAGITDHPGANWMSQVARNATLEELGYLHGCRYVLQDRDAKFYAEFRQTLAAGGVKCLRLSPRSSNLNAFAERWVRSVKEGCLSKLILFGEASLRRSLTEIPRALSYPSALARIDPALLSKTDPGILI